MSSHRSTALFLGAAAAAVMLAKYLRDGKLRQGAQPAPGGRIRVAQRGRVPKLALVSCRELMADPAIFETDEGVLYKELEARGVPFDIVAWDDASVQWGDYHIIAIRTTWDYSVSEEVCNRFKAWVQGLARLPSAPKVYNHPRVISANTHKAYLPPVCGHAGVPGIPTIYVWKGTPASSIPDLSALIARHGVELMLKPCVSASSRNTFCVSTKPRPLSADGKKLFLTPEEGQAFLVEAVLGRPSSSKDEGGIPPADMMIQPYVPSVGRHGELSVVCLDGQVTHAVRKVPREADFRTQAEYTNNHEAVDVTPEAAAAASAVVSAMHRVVETETIPDYISSPVEVVGAPPRPLPSPHASMLVARVDFLVLDDEARAEVWPAGYPPFPNVMPKRPGTHPALQTPSPVSPAGEGSSFTSPLSAAGTGLLPDTPASSGAPASSLLLLELEVIEPSLFLVNNPRAAGVLADAFQRELALSEAQGPGAFYHHHAASPASSASSSSL